MTFPVYFHVFGQAIHPHLALELMAYAAGSQLYFALRRRARRAGGDVLEAETNLWLIVGCVVGALIGSKCLAWAESIREYWPHRADPRAWLGGKTIVGGLLGGTLAVEWIKRRNGIATRTGDLFALPLAAGIAIGRVGCFFGGLGDLTYGGATALPWGIDFGDGIRRHPTQLYEIAAMAVLAFAIRALARRPHRTGGLFRLFLTAYLAWRFAIDFLKPEPRWLGLTTIQWTCLAALGFYCRDMIHLLRLARPNGAQAWANESAPISSTTSPSPSARSVSAK